MREERNEPVGGGGVRKPDPPGISRRRKTKKRKQHRRRNDANRMPPVDDDSKLPAKPVVQGTNSQKGNTKISVIEMYRSESSMTSATDSEDNFKPPAKPSQMTLHVHREHTPYSDNYSEATEDAKPPAMAVRGTTADKSERISVIKGYNDAVCEHAHGPATAMNGVQKESMYGVQRKESYYMHAPRENTPYNVTDDDLEGEEDAKPPGMAVRGTTADKSERISVIKGYNDATDDNAMNGIQRKQSSCGYEPPENTPYNVGDDYWEGGEGTQAPAMPARGVSEKSTRISVVQAYSEVADEYVHVPSTATDDIQRIQSSCGPRENTSYIVGEHHLEDGEEDARPPTTAVRGTSDKSGIISVVESYGTTDEYANVGVPATPAMARENISYNLGEDDESLEESKPPANTRQVPATEKSDKSEISVIQTYTTETVVETSGRNRTSFVRVSREEGQMIRRAEDVMCLSGGNRRRSSTGKYLEVGMEGHGGVARLPPQQSNRRQQVVSAPGAFRVGDRGVATRLENKIKLASPTPSPQTSGTYSTADSKSSAVASMESGPEELTLHQAELGEDDEFLTPFEAVRVEERPKAPKIQLMEGEVVENGAKRRSDWSVQIAASFLVLLILCGGVAVIIALLITDDASVDQDLSSSTLLPTPSPSLRVAPTAPPVRRRIIRNREELVDAIDDYILTHGERDVDPTLVDTIEYWNVTAVTVMHDAFSKDRFAVTQTFNRDISRWDVSNVVDMTGLFFRARFFNQSLSTWNTSKVTGLSNAFFEAREFNGDISAWDTSRVKSLAGTWWGATSFNVDISQWDVSKATDLRNVFNEATSFNQSLRDWNVSRVASMRRAFRKASSFNQDVGRWNVSKVTDLYYTFAHSSFNSDISRWNTSKAVVMTGMFRSASFFDQNVSLWDVERVTSMEDMFHDASSFNHKISWHTANLVSAKSMFEEATSFNSPIYINLSQVFDMNDFLKGAVSFNQYVDSWNVSGVGWMRSTFGGATLFNQDLSSWDVQNLVLAPFMFQDAKAFNGNVTTWKTSRLVSAEGMFRGAESFDQDLSSWNVSMLTDVDQFLANASSFDHNLCPWSERLAVEVEMLDMFDGTSCPVTNVSLPGIALCHNC